MAGGGDAAQSEVAKALGLEEGAVRVAIHRLRKRYRALLRDEIARTLADAAMVEEEMGARCSGRLRDGGAGRCAHERFQLHSRAPKCFHGAWFRA